MKSYRYLAAIAACSLAAVTMAAQAAKPAHRTVRAPITIAQPAVPALPLGTHLFSPGTTHEKPRLAAPATSNCASLTASAWVQGSSAQLCGIASATNANVTVYPGIRYATAARWATPQAFRTGSQNLTGFGPVCPQPSAKGSGKQFLMSEDCLYVNVWVPQANGAPVPNANTLPVMVFIHGGAFLEGAGSLPVYDGTTFASNNVILVTLNYRLGALGFLVGKQYGVTAGGNYGVMDQQLALKWVHDNIAAFGGDPTKVTIFGESAGAMSVGIHLFATPTSTSLFRAAIMESNPVGLLYQDIKAAGPSAIGGQFLGALCKAAGAKRCDILSTFDPRTAPLAAVMAAQGGVFTSLGGLSDVINGYMGLRGLPFQPVIDHTLVMGQPSQGYVMGSTPKPMVFGVNHDEGAVFAALVAAGVGEVTGKPASQSPPQAIYDLVVDGGFGLLAAGNFGKANARYSAKPPNYTPGVPFYDNYGQAAANMVLDYDFAIGNVVMANNAYVTGGAPAMYAYYFTQAPVWDIYGNWNDITMTYTAIDNDACAPNGGNFVCHGAELPYVFATIASVAPPNVVVPQANLALAGTMNAAWAAFATNPSSPGSMWTKPYTSSAATPNELGGPAVVFNILPPPPQAIGTIDPNNVYNVWKASYASAPGTTGGGAAPLGNKKPAKH